MLEEKIYQKGKKIIISRLSHNKDENIHRNAKQREREKFIIQLHRTWVAQNKDTKKTTQKEDKVYHHTKVYELQRFCVSKNI